MTSKNELLQKLKHKINHKTKPLGALGKLEEIALQIGLIQHTLSPILSHPAMVVFAGDHAIANDGVSAYPSAVTYQMVLNFVRGGAGINVFTKQHNIQLEVVDAGVMGDFEENLPITHAKIRKGTRNYRHEKAISPQEYETLTQKSHQIVDDLYQKGTNIIGFGEMGIGNTASASLIMHHICNIPLPECVGAGTGLDNEGISKKLKILQEVTNFHALKTNTPKENNQKNMHHEILMTFGGYEIAMMTQAMLKAKELNMVILIDGFIATSALLIAQAENKDILVNCIFCHVSEELGHKKMLAFLQVSPILHLNMRLGEGTGVALAYPIIQSAVNFLNEMASFEEAGVSEKV